MSEEKYIYFAELKDWHNWLQENHAVRNEIWLVFFKVHTGKPCLPYNDSVEEALCYGWIDSLIKKLDEERYARKFTPRRPGSNWSLSNKQRVRKLIKEGRMMPVGLAMVNFPIDAVEEESNLKSQEFRLTDDLLSELQADTPAWENYNQLPPSQRRAYIGWIMSAKKDETRRRRFSEALSKLRQGKRLGMK